MNPHTKCLLLLASLSASLSALQNGRLLTAALLRRNIAFS